MVVKKRVSGKKYRITVKHKFAFADLKSASNAKISIRKKVPKIVFSKPVKSGGKYVFSGTIVYTKAINAPLNIVSASIKKIIKKSAPRAIVTVKPL